MYVCPAVYYNELRYGLYYLIMVHTAKYISNHADTQTKNHTVLLKLTNTHVNVLKIKHDFALDNYTFKLSS